MPHDLQARPSYRSASVNLTRTFPRPKCIGREGRGNDAEDVDIEHRIVCLGTSPDSVTEQRIAKSEGDVHNATTDELKRDTNMNLRSSR